METWKKMTIRSSEKMTIRSSEKMMIQMNELVISFQMNNNFALIPLNFYFDRIRFT